jgi:hypothetical protein
LMSSFRGARDPPAISGETPLRAEFLSSNQN